MLEIGVDVNQVSEHYIISDDDENPLIQYDSGSDPTEGDIVMSVGRKNTRRAVAGVDYFLRELQEAYK